MSYTLLRDDNILGLQNFSIKGRWNSEVYY